MAATPSLACINDRDTLAQEVAAQKADSSGLPNVVRVVTGHFERNPPQYYQMRLERVTEELKATPEKLDLYDDAGAACDRLGRSKDALEWMEKKQLQLGISKLDPKLKREHEYRYFANAGTFHAHLWLRSGANRKDFRELKTGHDMIKRAIEIKPNAHFGREKYQLLLMEWILNPPKPNSDEIYFSDFLNLSELNQENDEDLLTNSKYPDAITGLSGLIVLGDAWASFDVYHALMEAVGAQGDASLSVFTAQRCRELLDNGRGSLSPVKGGIGSWNLDIPVTETPEKAIRQKYFELRANAMTYQDYRVSYMMRKFDIGWHPDTHPTFWDGWKEPPLPSLEMPAPDQEEREANSRKIKQIGQSLALGLIALVVGIFIGRRRSA